MVTATLELVPGPKRFSGSASRSQLAVTGDTHSPSAEKEPPSASIEASSSFLNDSETNTPLSASPDSVVLRCATSLGTCLLPPGPAFRFGLSLALFRWPARPALARNVDVKDGSFNMLLDMNARFLGLARLVPGPGGSLVCVSADA